MVCLLSGRYCDSNIVRLTQFVCLLISYFFSLSRSDYYFYYYWLSTFGHK